jgi:hypothetical protein
MAVPTLTDLVTAPWVIEMPFAPPGRPSGRSAARGSENPRR